MASDDLTTEELQVLREIVSSRRAASSDVVMRPAFDVVDKLRQAFEELTAAESFAPGDIVYWKSERLKNKRVPRLGQPGVVIEILEESAVDGSKEAASTYYREPLDIVLGMFDDEDPDSLLVYHFDSRRFTKRQPA